MTLFTPLTTASKLKILSFLAGLGLLTAGALLLDYPDWDIGISFLMASSTFASAEWATSVLWERRWRWLLVALFDKATFLL
jgi:hypothetical protein